MSLTTVSGIFNRPPAISDDTLQFSLYPRDDLADRASVTTLAALMGNHVDALLPGHLWHRDSFELKVVRNTEGEGWMLEGRMRVGDCVDDEWCSVWLLREISKNWDVVISVFDSDGEFLLIEAAEALPSWVTPSNAENRVWIYNYHLHLIPLTHVSAPSSKPRRRRYTSAKDSDDEDGVSQDPADEDYITVQDAIKVVCDPRVDTLAPPPVEQLVWKRISDYPAAARQHVHVAKAYLPVEIANALLVDPSLVQKPIETFYTRDALQLRAAHKMARFPPEPSILTSVKMTRTAYAQLVGQRFHPPKVFGRWIEQEGTKEWRWRDIGMKIACGFEMIYQESKGRTEAASISPDAMKSSAAERRNTLRRDSDYVKYIENLASSSYFKGELEGSETWNELEDKAVVAFLEARREDDASRPSFAAGVNSALSRAGNIPSPVLNQAEDPDDWLNVDADDLDRMLRTSFGDDARPHDTLNSTDIGADARAEQEEDGLTKQHATRLQDFAKKVEEFVEGEGDIQGARFHDEQFSDDEASDDELSEVSDNSDEDMGVLNDDEQNERRAAMDSLVPPLDASEYGTMPASFYSNSQRVAPTTMETEVVTDTQQQLSTPIAERPIRPPILVRDRYDGVDSDDETDSDGGQTDEEEDNPQVVGEIEVDMDAEEDEFLEFARQALGVSDEQWGDILRERRGRGAYVPSCVVADSGSTAKPSVSAPLAAGYPGRTPTLKPQQNANPKIDSFEAVMAAMDHQLALLRAESSDSKTRVGEGKGKTKASAKEIDIEAAMDAELEAALERGADSDEEELPQDPGTGQYNLIKNFLESFKSQGGLAGPVGSLAGRLQPGWTLPRDES